MNQKPIIWGIIPDLKEVVIGAMMEKQIQQ